MKDDPRTLPAVSSVERATVQSGVSIRCAQQQDGGNGNPKHRTTNCWGIGKQSIDDVAALNSLKK